LRRLSRIAELDRLIADLGTNPLAKGELRQVGEGIYVSLSQSQPGNLDYAFCLNSGADECTFSSERQSSPVVVRDGLLVV
jgi:hypothetical protein